MTKTKISLVFLVIITATALGGSFYVSQETRLDLEREAGGGISDDSASGSAVLGETSTVPPPVNLATVPLLQLEWEKVVTKEGTKYKNGDFVIRENDTLQLAPNSVNSANIAHHTIRSEDIHDGAITSRTIENHTIQGQDVNPETTLTIGSLTVTGTTTFLGAQTASGDLDMQGNIIMNIGDTGTDFTSTGGLNLAGNIDFNGTSNDIAGTLNLSGNTLTSSGALTVTPAAGTNLNVTLSTTGDFAVNTNQLYVDTSAGNVGIGDSTPTNKLDVAGAIGISDTTVIDASRNLVNIGSITSGLINGQTISSAANFTGTVNAVTGYQANGLAPLGNVLRGDGTNFVSATLSGGDITGAALTKTDDTNVTLTLGGTPATALLRAASLTLGWTGQLGLTRGGTAASLTASNGGIVYSTASALAILSGTATAGQILQSGASGAPAWSTPTYPSASGTVGKILRSDGTNNVYTTATFADTYTTSNLLYSNGANTVAGLATGNSGVLVTSATGVPSILDSMTNGQLVVGSTGAIPVLATLTGTTDQIVVTNGAGTITLSSPQSINTTSTPQFARMGLGVPADATNILTATSSSSTNLSKTLNISHTGAITGTGYAGYFSKTGASTTNVGLYTIATGATNNYSLQVDSPAATADTYTIYANGAAQNYFAGNIGIGTTGPGSLLDVRGQITASKGAIGAPTYSFVGDTTTGLTSFDGVSFSGIVAGTQIMQVNTSGVRVVTGAFLGNNGSASAPGYTFNGNTGDGMWLPAGGSIAFSTVGVERLRISNAGLVTVAQNLVVSGTGNTTIAGNVGIGTTNPEYALDVLGGSAALQIRRTNANPTVTIRRADATIGNANDLGYLRFSGDDASVVDTEGASIRAASDSDWGSGDTPGRLTFWTTSDNTETPSERMRITSDGNVGIGTTTPGQKLEVYSSSGSNYIRSARASQGAGQVGYVVGGGTSGVDWLMYQTTSSDNLTFYGGGADRVTFKSDGNVGIGTTSPGAKLNVVSDIASDYATELFNDGNATTRWGLLVQSGLDDQTAAGPSTLVQFNDGDGTAVGSITFGSSVTNYNTSSDVRLKQNIVDSSLGLSDLMRIQVRDYTWRADESNRIAHGFIAQELYNIYPDAVTVPKDDRFWMVDYTKLTPLIVKSIQDQQGEIALQKGTLDTISLATAENITTVSELQASVDTELLVISGSVNTLNDGLTTQGEALKALKKASTEQSDRISAIGEAQGSDTSWQSSFDTLSSHTTLLDSKMETLADQVASLADFYATFELGNFVTKDSLGNVDIGTGMLRAGAIKSSEGLFRKITIEKGSDEDALVGKSKIQTGETKIIIETTAVEKDSNILVTPRSAFDGSLAVTDVASGKSFTVETAKPADKDIPFTWLIVGQKEAK